MLESMVQKYTVRFVWWTNANVTIATSKSQVSAIHNQLGEDVGISVEPCRRDTFPAIALAAAYLRDKKHFPLDEAIVICPVDSYVDNDYFESLEELGKRATQSSANLVLMGIEPTYPSANMAILFQSQEKTSAQYPCSKRNLQRMLHSLILHRSTLEWWCVCTSFWAMC